MKRYNPREIEPKWQKIWDQSGIYRASEDQTKPKRYVLEYFPYPSGAAMHVGHVRNYTIGDVVARYYRMKGYNVLHPMGWDAFGLPAENYAIKTGISPRQAIDENTDRFRQQLMQMGFSYDWTREIDSTDPNYYKWTQWFFIFLYNRGLAYQQESLQWWCPHDKTVLANEQVENGRCWRCGHLVEKKSLKQWFFKITDYADRLDEDLANLNWSEAIKSMQHNWIGKSVGAEIKFEIKDTTKSLKVFTTRPDTIFGATFIVLAPEHQLVEEIVTSEYRAEVAKYLQSTLAKSDIERQETNREKTGQFTGAWATNPATGQPIPIWVADYVLSGYGTGAIMAVPAHDERDWEFAKKFDLPITEVIKAPEGFEGCYAGEGKLINSAKFDGLESAEAREKIVADINGAKEKVNYKMRDWLISRQRYWGAPIPMVHCEKCGTQPVPEKDLPVVLPELKSFEPSGDGRSPLANVEDFVNVKCPQCDGPAERETDTMDGFACSSWYFLRFADPHNDNEAFSKAKAEFWLPVDDYIGGAEHAVMHLLYARFWTKVMFDAGLISFDEPFSSLRNHGMILAPDGAKMSKSKGNTIEPDALLEQGYGADSIRLMELFIGPWNQAANWSVEGMGGTFRFLQRIWTLIGEYQESGNEPIDNVVELALRASVHRTIKKVTEDLEKLDFNTAISAMMALVNDLYKFKAENGISHTPAWGEAIEMLIILLAPFAPHISEEIWHDLGHGESIHLAAWPKWNEELIKEEQLTIAVQVNGKVRAEIIIDKDTHKDEVLTLAKEDENVQKYIEGKALKKEIYIQGRLVSLVV